MAHGVEDSGEGHPWTLIAANVLFWVAVLAWPVLAIAAEVWFGFQAPSTESRRLYLHTATVFLPGLALVGYLSGTGWRRLTRAGQLLAVGVLALLATGVIDVLAYPQYPTVGPHEAVAVVLVLPAIEGPLLVLALWRSLALSGRAWICAAVLGAAVVLATLHGGGDMDWKLPLSAQVSRLASTELQDYSVYRLHARNVTREEAERYASTLGLAASPADTTCELGAADWVRSEDVACPPSEGLHWERDDRSPNGLGCVMHSTWAVDALYVSQVCDYGI